MRNDLQPRYVFPNVPQKWTAEERNFALALRQLFDTLFARTGRDRTTENMDYLFMMSGTDLPTDKTDKMAKVLRNYRDHGWNKTMVWDAVTRWITAEEYETITGEAFPPVRPD